MVQPRIVRVALAAAAAATFMPATPGAAADKKPMRSEPAFDRVQGRQERRRARDLFRPVPPVGAKPHPFTFLLMATDLAPGTLQPGMTRDELAAALKGHIVDRTMLVLRYGH